MKFLDIETLARGNDKQVRAYEFLKNAALEKYSPLVVGALPLGLDVESSAVELVCSSENLELFSQEMQAKFSTESGFHLEHGLRAGRPAVIVKFENQGLRFEILAQAASSFTQPAVVELLVEARLLSFAPREAREEIRELIRSGLDVASAFEKCFELEDSAELLKIGRLPDHEILHVAHRFRFRPS